MPASINRDTSFRNRILGALSAEDIEAIRPHLHLVSMVSGQVLHEADSPIVDVFFVEEGVVSLTAFALDDGQVEVGVTGREGLVGAPVILNREPYAVNRAFTQVPGAAYRMNSAVLRIAIEHSVDLRDRCLRYIDFLLVQTAQVAACNARHNLPQRLARWLLMVRDRTDSATLPMTQEFLSVMLAVRRPGVSVAASTLQAAGLIRVHRGNVTILDHEGLVGASCDCYRTVRLSHDRILY